MPVHLISNGTVVRALTDLTGAMCLVGDFGFSRQEAELFVDLCLQRMRLKLAELISANT